MASVLAPRGVRRKQVFMPLQFQGADDGTSCFIGTVAGADKDKAPPFAGKVPCVYISTVAGADIAHKVPTAGLLPLLVLAACHNRDLFVVAGLGYGDNVFWE